MAVSLSPEGDAFARKLMPEYTFDLHPTGLGKCNFGAFPKYFKSSDETSINLTFRNAFTICLIGEFFVLPNSYCDFLGLLG